MTDEHSVPEFMAAITGTEYSRDWIGRVREADADAEKAFSELWRLMIEGEQMVPDCLPLFAIAAELRAQRIARRPGAGQ